MISFVIPAYNEAGSIQVTIDQLRSVMDTSGVTYELIVIDDGGTDATAALARERDVLVIQHPINRGYGQAIKTGIDHSNYEWCAIVDADGSYPVNKFPDLMKYIPQFDMVVGARTGISYWGSIWKRLGRIILGGLITFVVGISIPDPNSGMRIFRRSIALAHNKRISSGFSFTTTLTLAMLLEGHTVKYAPIDYFPRSGKSKVKIGRDTLRVVQILAQAIIFYNPLKLFLALCILTVMIGLIFLLIDLIAGLTIGLLILAASIFIAVLVGSVGFLAEAIRLHRITLDK
ncbi:MAG: glycosyltransferase family 2 protein [Anaerolineae bacterium]|nr:glycosyltransferase family 2 protein [Anaerolineae bacterium]